MTAESLKWFWYASPQTFFPLAGRIARICAALAVVLTLAGLYATHFLTLMTAVLLPVDTLSGEIASGVAQTVASKPVRRSSIVLGKWLAFSLVAVAYFALVPGNYSVEVRFSGGTARSRKLAVADLPLRTLFDERVP